MKSIKQLSQINLNLLVPLNALLEYKSVTRAAEVMGIAQPTMSKHLGALRKIFADKLLVRVGSSMQLTPKALEIESSLTPILDNLMELFSAQFNPSSDQREFIIACPDYVSEYILPDVLKPYLGQDSGLTFSLINWDLQAKSLLLDGILDFVITIDEDFAPNFIRKKVDTDDWVLVMTDQHPLAGERELTVDAIFSYPYVQTITGGGASKIIDRALRKKGIKRKIKLTTQGYIPMYAAIKNSILISIVPRHQAINMTEDYSLIYRDLPFHIPKSTHSIYWHEKFKNDLAHQWFRENIINDIILHPHHRI
ncbi:MAG: LysR family transcriptional regulator [Colwellia sp.]